MKKTLYILVLTLLLFSVCSCKEEKTPFDYFENIDAYHKKIYTVSVDGYGNRMTFTSEVWVEGNIEYTVGSSSYMGTKIKMYREFLDDGYYMYEYNYKTSKWSKKYYSYSSSSSNDFDRYDINNYDYDKLTKVYKVKGSIDTGVYSDFKVYMDYNNVVMKYESYDGTYNYTWTETYLDFDGNYNLSLPI